MREGVIGGLVGSVIAAVGVVALGVTILNVPGCMASPTVVYVKVTDSKTAQGITDSVYLAGSEIVIDKISGSKDEFSASSRPVEMREYKVGIKADGSLGVKTKVNITKRENTDLLASIGVETIDERKKIIEQVTSTIGKMAKFITTDGGDKSKAPDEKPCEFVPEATTFPIVLKLGKADLKDGKNAKPVYFNADGKKATKASENCIRVTPGDSPVDVVDEVLWGTSTPNFYYSSCRDATVEFQFAEKGPTVSKTTRIADPNRVQFVQFPYKGSITAHSQCGVSVRTENVQSDLVTFELIDAFVKALKDLKDPNPGKK
jgi:hypothetical protein